MTTALTEYPGLEAKAQKVFSIPFAELAPHLQKSIRKEVMQDAAEEMHKALCHAFYRNHEYAEYCSGCAAARDAIAKAEGRL